MIRIIDNETGEVKEYNLIQAKQIILKTIKGVWKKNKDSTILTLLNICNELIREYEELYHKHNSWGGYHDTWILYK